MKKKNMMKHGLTMTMAATLLWAASCSTTGNDAAGDLRSNIMAAEGYAASKPAEENPGAGGDRFAGAADNPFVKTALQPVSTFSVDADGASYAIVRRYLESGYNVNPQSVRIEELLNYFTFDYPAPTGDESVAITAEAGDCPWAEGHCLLQLGIKGRELTALPRANFVFLIDVSGSMGSDDKLPLLKKGLKELLAGLSPDDRISIVTYSGQVSKLLESTPVRQRDVIEQAISRLKASGATAGGAALEMAYEEAMANYDPAANNRIIMGTDGDFNVGLTSEDAIVEMVQSYASKGIYMTCLGFGTGNLNDAMLEKVSNAGNGTYHYIDCEDEMMRVFVHERGQFVSVASDAKCQVTFDSTLVSSYRLIGYENRVMATEDFADDTKDAGEIGAGQTITALYELVLKDDRPQQWASADLLTFDFRYKPALGSASRALQLTLKGGRVAEKRERTPDFSFAAGVAAYGMQLRHSPYSGTATYDMAAKLVESGLGPDPHGYRAALKTLIGKAARQQADSQF